MKDLRENTASDAPEGAPDERVDAALREALATVPELPPELAQRAGRRARGALRRPGEGTLSVRGVTHFWESAGVAALVLLAGLFYTAVEGLQIASIFGG